MKFGHGKVDLLGFEIVYQISIFLLVLLKNDPRYWCTKGAVSISMESDFTLFDHMAIRQSKLTCQF